MKLYQKIITSVMLLGILVFTLVPSQPAYADGLFPAASLAGESAASAATGPFDDVGAKVRDQVKNVTSKIGELLKNGALIAIKNALSAFLGRMAYDTAVYISSGGQGQDSLVFKTSAEEYFSSVSDAALGGMIEGFASGAGLDAAGLCNPGDNFRINLTVGLETNFGQARQPYKPACTLTELAGNWRDAYSDPKFSDFLALQFDPTANPLGISMEVENLVVEEQAKKEDAAKVDREEGNGFKPKVEQIAKTILTPGSLIQAQAVNIDDGAKQVAYDTIGNPTVDALNIFTTTLINKLITRIQDGIANIKSGTSLAGILGGKFSGTVSGRSVAQETFAELRQTTFGSSGTFDVLSELAICPDEKTRTVNNCAMGSDFQKAVQEGWTVQEFIDFQDQKGASFTFANDALTGAQIDGSQGINQHGIVLLKKFRVIPVGWQVASDYIAATNTDINAPRPTLKQIANCYNYCGTKDPDRECDIVLNDADGHTTNYSPFCKLIDPNWVLKAPQNFCEREAPGPVIAETEAFDTDSNAYTQQGVLSSRLNYCADTRGCIKEGSDGTCTAYGYCMAEKRVYQFEGDSCEPEYSSCQTFVDEEGNEVSYVKNSLNYNDCATDPGCQWYCKSKNAAGEFDCAGPTSRYVSCSEDVANNETNYGLAADSVSLDSQASCSCSVQQTCQVLPGSTGGDSIINETGVAGTDGLIDYRQCTVTNTDRTTSVCTLSDNCGTNNPNYDAATGKCTCKVTSSGSVAEGSTGVDIGVQTQAGGRGIQNCLLEDQNSDGSADQCTSSYSTFTSSPVCKVTGNMNCGDVCTTTAGGSCTNNLGNICVDGSATDGDPVSGKCKTRDNCSLANGTYKCTSDNGNTCVLGTVAEQPSVKTDTIYFDDNVEECGEGDAGCNQYIRTKADTNLLPNAFFSQLDTARSGVGDSDENSILTPQGDGDYLAFCADNGRGCRTGADCNAGIQCLGWQQTNTTAYVLDSGFTAGVSSDLGSNYVQIASGTGTLAQTVDTGSALKNRTFTFAYRALADTGSCTSVAFTVGSADGSKVSPVITAAADGTDYEYTNVWQNYVATFTFPDDTNVNQTAIKVSINAATDCNINVAGAALYEDSSFKGFVDYSTNNITYLNGETLSCKPDEVGCELYIPKGLSAASGIPGTITNPNSSACVNADGSYNFGNPQCSQCNGNPALGQAEDYFVGCDFYQEVELSHTAPLTSDQTWLTSSQREGVKERSGKYCSGDSSRHCLVDSDCGQGSSCVEQLSIVPSSGQQCPVSAVGCEQYTNLSSVEAGGEGLEYYTQLKQCVRKDDQQTAVFYTFEGSDVAGVQVQDHTLKVNQDSADGRPCTNLDLQSENFNANCADNQFPILEQASWDCGPDGDIDADGANNELDGSTDDQEYGVNADCRQYVTDAGKIFYRFESQVIEASDDCTPLRNANDGRVYFALPNTSISCQASYVGCREYKGTHSGSEATVVDERFDSNSTEQWAGATSTSNESILQSGFSLQLHDGNTGSQNNTAIRHPLFTKQDDVTKGLLTGGNTYVLSFWAKGTGTLSAALDFNGEDAGENYYFTNNGSSTSSADRITLGAGGRTGWQYYEVGPIVLPESEALSQGDEYLYLQFDGDEAYIDTIQLSDSDSQYLIQDTARSCNNFEGCRLYQDRDRNNHYLKSFLKLCEDSVVGCEAMVATQNSKHPYTTAFNTDNEYPQDDVVVQPDKAVTLVYNESNICSSAVMGCTSLGLPDVDERTGQVNGFANKFFLDRPDDYSTILCEQPQLSCKAFSSDFDGTVYFKDPGDKVCELREYSSNGNVFNGWFKKDSTSELPDCPTQYDYSAYGEHYASQPLGGVCNSNSIKGDDNRVGHMCNSDVDCYPSGWVTSDPRPRCISTIEDDVDVNTADGVDLRNIVTDFGWTAGCPNDQSGCSEYSDPYSPNIKERISNWSFEDDARDDDGTYYQPGDTRTGYPDYWKIVTDLNADGTSDFSGPCTQPDVSQVNINSTDQVNPADGGFALKLSSNCAIQTSARMPLRPDKTYTIQGRIKMNKPDLDHAQFSLGLQYYVSDGADANEDPDLLRVSDVQLYPVANHLTIAAEDGSDVDGKSYWYRFQGSIGVNTTAPLPIVDNRLAEYVSVFVANHSTSTIYVDAISLKENDKYYYLDYTVDGTTEHEQTSGSTSCINQDTNAAEITSDGGCVAFRDTTSDAQNTSQDGLDCTPCLVSPNSDACRFIADACDTNVVLKVKKDRQCSEWLSCLTAGVATDENGNVTSECRAIVGCTELDESGRCSRTIDDSEDLSLTSDEHYTSGSNDAGSLTNIQDKTGYTKVGVTWNNVRYCNGGPADGARCTSDADCADNQDPSASGTCTIPLSTQGYYPYGSMTEVGEQGAQNGEDLIELNDFEGLTCAGGRAISGQACTLNGNASGFPGHCYTNTLIQMVESNPDDDIRSYSDLVYVDGDDFSKEQPDNIAFCPNSPSFSNFWPFGDGNYNYSEHGWQALGSANILVTQFQNYENCQAPCNDINLNNVLEVGGPVDASAPIFSGGVSYDLQDNIVLNGDYALSFKGRYSGDYAAVGQSDKPSAVSICLKHHGITDAAGNELDKKDCFVQGYGMADIVFAIDTSGSMVEEIAAVAAAVPDLASKLASAGIDARFALVDMDDNDAGGTGDAASYVDLNFTSKITGPGSFQEAVTAMRAEAAYVDPWKTIQDVAGQGSLNGTLTFRSGAQHYMIVVTDTEDEMAGAQGLGADNEIGSAEAINAATAAELKVSIITSDVDYCANGASRAISCAQNYEDNGVLAMGGAIYNYTDPTTGTTYSDWVTRTTIMQDIFNNILKTVSIFQFNNDLKTYTFGPIKIANKTVLAGEESDEDIITTLDILGSDGTTFQIDDVSLLPVLEVNKELNPISRQCRAYPEENSLQCSYVLNNGTRFVGWNGYCLEADPSNPNYCITWWPTDTLKGELSIVQREPDGYEGRSSVYYCLLSKGLATPGFCNVDSYSNPSDDGYKDQWGQGVICSSSSQGVCGGGANSCFQGADYVLPDTPPFAVINMPVIEHDADTLLSTLGDDPYTESFLRDGGQCMVINGESEISCNAWTTTGTCSEEGYFSKEACEDNSGTWTDTFDIMNSTAILSTGKCNDAGKPTDIFDNAEYYNNYGDPARDQMTDDKYCFYDVDGVSGAEVRSTRSCSTDNGCRTRSSDDFMCASLGCAGGFDNKSCSFRGNECQQTAAAKTDIPYNTRPMSWQMPDPAEHLCAIGDPRCIGDQIPGLPLGFAGKIYNQGVIVRLPANELLRNIHASEMQTISFNPGSAGFGGGAGAESPYWGQLQGSQNGSAPNGSLGMYDNQDDADKVGELGDIWLSNLKDGAIQKDATGKILNTGKNCYAADDGVAGIGCRIWGLWDSDMDWSNYALKNLPQFDGPDDHGYDLVYTWNWSNFNFSNSISEGGCNRSGTDSAALNVFDNLRNEVKDADDLTKIFESGCLDDSMKFVIGPDGASHNPWKEIQTRNASLWNQFYEDDVTDSQPKMVVFEGDDLNGLGNFWPDAYDQNGALAIENHDGANIMSLYIDFNDEGYIQAVYTMIYFAARGTEDTPFQHAIDPGNFAMVETTYQAPMHLDIQTRESCLIVGEAVNSGSDTQSWAHRIDEGSYEINHSSVDNAYDRTTYPYDPYGSIGPMEGSPEDWDFIPNDAAHLNEFWGNLNTQPAIAMKIKASTGDGADAGHPLACVGDCGQTSCVGNANLPTTNSCTGWSKCVGGGNTGICMGVGDTTMSNNGTDLSYTLASQRDNDAAVRVTLQDQIEDTITDGRDRLKHIFANIRGFYQLNFSTDPTKRLSVYTGDTPNYWIPEGSTSTIFANMQRCPGNKRPTDFSDSEYCGVLPVIQNWTINDNQVVNVPSLDIADGQTITMRFNVAVDEEQTPLQHVYIDWNDGTDPVEEPWGSKADDISYTHEYSCNYNNDQKDGNIDNNCYFKPKITVVDNWNWCSGNEGTGGARYNDKSGQSAITSCGTYDTSDLTLHIDVSE